MPPPAPATIALLKPATAATPPPGVLAGTVGRTVEIRRHRAGTRARST